MLIPYFVNALLCQINEHHESFKQIFPILLDLFGKSNDRLMKYNSLNALIPKIQTSSFAAELRSEYIKVLQIFCN